MTPPQWGERAALATVLSCLLPVAAPADHDFEYVSAIACGPEVTTRIPQGTQAYAHFVIYDGQGGRHFVIMNAGREYASFKRMHYSELYTQRGGERWLEFERKDDGSIAFELHDQQARYGKYLADLRYDPDQMRASVEFNWRDTPLALVCWDFKKRYTTE